MTANFLNFRTNIIETFLALLIFLSLIGLMFYFYDIIFPDLTQYDPLRDYDTNSGIIKISISSFITRTIFLLTFLALSINKYKNNKPFKVIYLLSALTIGFLQWFEIYYGSTFYYGEVRDKQGIMFPILASLMVILTIWKIKYSGTENYNLKIKVSLTTIINIGLYWLWRQVYESWGLWQS